MVTSLTHGRADDGGHPKAGATKIELNFILRKMRRPLKGSIIRLEFGKLPLPAFTSP